MRSLLCVRDFETQKSLAANLMEWGLCDIAVTADDVLRYVVLADAERGPYDVICLDAAAQSCVARLRRETASWRTLIALVSESGAGQLPELFDLVVAPNMGRQELETHLGAFWGHTL